MNLGISDTHQTTTSTLSPQPEKACYMNQSTDAIDQSSDSASSNGASPITPYDHKPFTFSEYGNRTKVSVALGTQTKEPSLHMNDIALNTQPYTYQQPVQPKQDAQQPTSQPLDNDVDTPATNQTNMPEIATAGNFNGDSITPKMPWENNHDDDTGITAADDAVRNQDTISLTFGAEEKYDMDSIGNSSCSIACLDFPSPPSSTPSLVPKLTIQTDRQQQHDAMETQQYTSTHPGNIKSMVSSRFKEIFDIEGTNIEWDYHAKYCQQSPVSATKSYSSPLAPLPEKSVSSFASPISPKSDIHLFLDKQQTTQPDTLSLRNNPNGNKTLGGFITNIGRSASSSSSSSTAYSSKTKPEGPTRSLSSSSSTSSLRGLMRSFSTTATNHYRHQTPKMTRHAAEEDGLTRAAQAVAASTTNLDDKLYLCREEVINESSNSDTTTSLDAQRRKISQLFSTAIKKSPSRRYTTKVVNMQPSPSSSSSSSSPSSSSSKKLLRRTVIYVNPEDGTEHNDFYADLLKQYQPQRPAPTPPSQPQRYRYDKTLPPVPPATETTSPSTRSSTSSHLSSSSTSSSSGNNQKLPSYLQGLELREMEDGSMEWGIIKKEGRRQSFFAIEHLQQNNRQDMMNTTSSNMDDGTEEHIEQQVLALMGLERNHLEKGPLNRPPPIPRRSPRRKPSTLLPSTSSSRNNNSKFRNSDDSSLPHSTPDTKDEDDETPPVSAMNVYYAPDMTLPSLLQLVSQTQQDNNDSNNSNSIKNIV